MAVQEKYDLQMKLEQKTSQEAWFNEEITHLRQQLADGQDNLRKTLETEKNTEISKLTRQVYCIMGALGLKVNGCGFHCKNLIT